MILSIDPSQPLPVYEQMREQIARMIVAGTLAPGSRLPTIRQLAADLGLAKGTVARAYELLEAEAAVEMRGRHGTFVLAPPATSRHPSGRDLYVAADAVVVTARQVGADLDGALAAVRRAWDRF